MEFLLLIFINIIMGTIFYLILKLKLEKYASDYREKRLKKEMDEIICEFNETAERNITILEKRIDFLKKLLEKAGTITKIDINIDDTKDIIINKKSSVDTDDSNISNVSEMMDNEQSLKHDTKITVSGKNVIEQGFGANNLIEKYHFLIKRKFETIFKSITKYKDNESISQKNNNSLSDMKLNNNNKFASLIDAHKSNQTKEVIDIIIDDNEFSSSKELKENADLSEVELEEMFSASDDKYLLISELNYKGYPTELISKCSGIPIGEIKLVLDLNSSI